MSSWEHHEIGVCGDCLHTLANGLPDDLGPRREDAVAAGIARWAADGWRLEPGDGEPWFSWARCEACGDGRGGDRHQVWAVRPPEQEGKGTGMGTGMNAVIHGGAAWRLDDDGALLTTPLGADGAPDWSQARAVDPRRHPDPNLVLAIHDTLLERRRPGPVAAAEVVDTTGIAPGFLVRDRQGTDLARYDRLDLAREDAARCGGRVYAWGCVDGGPAGWHQLSAPPAPRSATGGAQRAGTLAAGAPGGAAAGRPGGAR